MWTTARDIWRIHARGNLDKCPRHVDKCPRIVQGLHLSTKKRFRAPAQEGRFGALVKVILPHGRSPAVEIGYDEEEDNGQSLRGNSDY